jgi:hypothetical protein
MTTTQPKKKLIIKKKSCVVCGETEKKLRNYYTDNECVNVCAVGVCGREITVDRTKKIIEKKKLFLDKHKKKNSKVMAELLRERKGYRKIGPIKIVLSGATIADRVVVKYYYISEILKD